MNKSKNDGGPAFPQKQPLTGDCQGMTLRAYLAGQAMQGILARKSDWPHEIAIAALKYADALIAELEK